MPKVLSTISVNEQYVLIRFSDVNGILPSRYTEKIYQETRIKRIGSHYEEFVTTEKHKTLFDSTYQNRLIQAVVYDKYKIQFTATESYNIELIRFADSIYVYDITTKLEYTGRILDISFENAANSSFKAVTIEFYDVNTTNYPEGQPIVNPLRSDKITDRYEVNELSYVRLVVNSESENLYYYSPFYSEIVESDPENVQELELNGQITTTRFTTKTKRQLLLFLNESDLQEFKRYVFLCDGNTDYSYIYETPSVNYQAIERPEIEVERISGAIDLYRVIFKITTTINNKYKYE